MQVIVLGMHRSGTSLVARLLNCLGLYFGTDDKAMESDQYNPKGYWERKDVNEINKEIIWSLGKDWYNVADLDFGEISVADALSFEGRIENLVKELDSAGSWIIKDPRLCLTFPLWQPKLKHPIIVIVFRSPFEVALSLNKRNGFDIPFGIALWEYYNLNILKNTEGLNRYIVDYKSIINDPELCARDIGDWLISNGFLEIKDDQIKQFVEFVDLELYRNKDGDIIVEEYLTRSQIQLLHALETGTALQGKVPDLSPNSLSLINAREETLLKINELSRFNRKLKEENVKLQEEKRLGQLEVKRLLSHVKEKEARNEVNQQRLNAQITDLILQKKQIEKDLDIVKGQLKKKNNEVESVKTNLLQIEGQLDRLRQDLAISQERIDEQRSDLGVLTHWIDGIIRDIDLVFNSLSWRSGKMIFSFLSRIMLKETGTAQEHIAEMTGEYASWKRTKKSIVNDLGNLEVGDGRRCLNPGNQEQIDIIVCVHNALEDVQVCIDSVINMTLISFRLILVDDGSNSATSIFLKELEQKYQNVFLHRNEVSLGYTKSANIGLRISTSRHVILLNSDTIVTDFWAQNLININKSDPSIGIVGPLSNAASWQSIPYLASSDDWSINDLPLDLTIEDIGELVYWLSDKEGIEVPFVNGFCFYISRAVIDRIGYFDEELFSRGYGEENDYCLRAINAGFKLNVAVNSYVYHAKSKSYTHNTRKVLSSEGDKKLRIKHGNARINDYLREIKTNIVLSGIRLRANEFFEGSYNGQFFREFEIGFLLPVGGIGGGIQSIVQEVLGMRKLGVKAVILTHRHNKHSYRKYYRDAFDGRVFVFYQDEHDLEAKCGLLNVLIATTWSTPRMIKKILGRRPYINAAYYIQDYEPFFFEEGSEKWIVAKESYTLIPDIIAFAKTDWICKKVGTEHGLLVQKVKPSLDERVFNVEERSPQRDGSVHIVAMIRPSTPRRSPKLTLSILERLKNELLAKVHIKVFGCNREEILEISNFDDFECFGIITKEEVADLYKTSDIFIDLSTYQAFGRTGLEAMACGCATILPVAGGVYEYAENGINSIIVDTTDSDQIYKELMRLVVDSDFREFLKNNALLTAGRYSVRSTVLSELRTLRLGIRRKEKAQQIQERLNRPQLANDGRLRIAAIVTRRADGQPTGSANIRLIQPLTHRSIKDKVKFQITSLDQLGRDQIDLLIIQRAVLGAVSEVKYVVDFCKWMNVRLVLEIDDNLFGLREKKDVDVNYSNEQYVALELLARSSDAVITSSEVLAEVLRDYNSNVHCLPNAHDEQVWLKGNGRDGFEPDRKIKTDNIVRILYMGTRTHANDLKIVESACQLIEREYGEKVQFEIVGGLPAGQNSFGRQIDPAGIRPEQDAYVQFVGWLRTNNHWDFGIIPLEVNQFNNSKSYIKFLDYTSLGLASICSDIEPYRKVVRHMENGLLVGNTTKEWYEAIKILVEDENIRGTIAANAFSDLCQKHNLNTVASRFFNVYYGIASDTRI